MLEKRISFKYKAHGVGNKLVEGIVYAFDKQEAFAKILDRGPTPQILE